MFGEKAIRMQSVISAVPQARRVYTCRMELHLTILECFDSETQRKVRLVLGSRSIKQMIYEWQLLHYLELQ